MTVQARPPGRPRSAEADEAILRAALELLASDGYRALTMERVRERSGVGKATLYRRYGSKEALVRAAIVHLNSDIPLPTTPARSSATSPPPPRRSCAGAARTGALTLMPRLLSDVTGDPEMHALFYEHLVEPRRKIVRAIVERAKERGEIRADVDPDLAVDLMVGPMIYRVIIAGGDIAKIGNPAEVLADGARGPQTSVISTRPPAPTPSVRRPLSNASSSSPTSSRRQPCSVRTCGSGWPRRAATTTGERSARAAISS